MRMLQRRVLGSLAERIADSRVPVGSGLDSSPKRSAASGVPAREYVLRRVASPSVVLKSVVLPYVASQCVELAHVFACLKARAAKSKVARLLGRTVRLSKRRVSSAFVSSAFVSSASGSASVSVPRLSSACNSMGLVSQSNNRLH